MFLQLVLKMYLILISLLCLPNAEGSILQQPTTDTSSTRLELASANLSTLSYKEIHRLIVIDQIQHHKRAQKSLNTRTTSSLDGLYDFCLDPNNQGFEDKWFEGSLRDICQQTGQVENFYRMPVPSAFNDVTSNTTVRNYIGWFWYQTIIGPAQLLGLGNQQHWHWFVQFESVNYLAIVWIKQVVGAEEKQTTNNNVNSSAESGDNSTRAHLLGPHVGGHLPFILNISNSLQLNESSRYRLTIAVSNRLTQDTIPSGRLVDLSEQVGRTYYKFQPDFDFFHFAGILGSVNLIQLPHTHLVSIEQLRWLEGDDSKLTFNVCHNPVGGQLLDGAQLEGRLLSWPDQEPLVSLSISLSGTEKEDTNTCNLAEFLLTDKLIHQLTWRPANGNPNHFARLITARFSLRISTQPSTLTDVFELRVAPKRSVTFSLDKGLIIDNETTTTTTTTQQLQGFGMHHEQMFSGRTMSLAAIMKDMYLLKQVGANVLRTSHYPYSNEFLDACDENGIMVIAECPAVGLSSFSDLKLMLHKQILLEMMQRDHHHASILMWSVANEPRSQLVEARNYFELLLRFAREQLAPFTVEAKRPLSAAIAQLHSDDKIAHTLDVIMINRYYGWYEFTGVLEAIQRPLLDSLAGWSAKHPGKPLILSEFGADTLAGLHSQTRLLFSEEYQRDLLLEHERALDVIVANRSLNSINLCGSMIWNFADFSTHDSLLRVGGNKKGIFTRDRSPKLAVESIRSIYLNRLARANSSFYPLNNPYHSTNTAH